MPTNSRSTNISKPNFTSLLLFLLIAHSTIPQAAAWNSFTGGGYNNYGYNTNSYASSGYTNTYTNAIIVQPQTTYTIAMTFDQSRFDYDEILVPASVNMPSGTNCTSSQILISKLYIQNTCIQQRNLEKNSCPSSVSNGQLISSSSGSTAISTNDTQAQENLVFSSSSSNYVTLSAAETSAEIDGGVDICAPSRYAYIYVQNNCAPPSSSVVGEAGVGLTISVRVYTGYSSSSCSSSGSSLPHWASITILVVIALLVLMCVFAGWRKRKNRLAGNNAANAVQMSTPVGTTPPPMYTNDNGINGAYGAPIYGNSNGTSPAGYPSVVQGSSGSQPVYGYPSVNNNSNVVAGYPPPAMGNEGGGVNQSPVWHAGGYPKV